MVPSPTIINGKMRLLEMEWRLPVVDERCEDAPVSIYQLDSPKSCNVILYCENLVGVTFLEAVGCPLEVWASSKKAIPCKVFSQFVVIVLLYNEVCHVVLSIWSKYGLMHIKKNQIMPFQCFVTFFFFFNLFIFIYLLRKLFVIH